MKLATSIQAASLFLLSSMSAFAYTPGCTTANCQNLPEPGSLALLAVGAAVGAAVWLRNRNK